MRYPVITAALALVAGLSTPAFSQSAAAKTDSLNLRKISDEALLREAQLLITQLEPKPGRRFAQVSRRKVQARYHHRHPHLHSEEMANHTPPSRTNSQPSHRSRRLVSDAGASVGGIDGATTPQHLRKSQ